MVNGYSHTPTQAAGSNGGVVHQELQTKIANLIGRTNPPPPGLHPQTRSEYFKNVFVNDIWPAIRDDYERMTKDLKKCLEADLHSRGIDAEVSARAKAIDSVRKSLERRETGRWKRDAKGFDKLEDIFEEMHDLAGLRIVLKYEDDLDNARSYIRETFVEKKVLSHLRPDRSVGRSWKQPWFGAYEAYNHRLGLRSKAGVSNQYDGVMFEIQIVTLSNNLHNLLAHDLLYKDSSGPLTREEEMVLDIARGAAKMYALAVLMMKNKLTKNQNTEKELDTHIREQGIKPKDATEAQAAVDSVIESYKASNKTLGFDDPKTLEIASGVARMLERQGRCNDALEWYHEIYKTRNKTLGFDHPETLEIACGVARMLERQGRCDDAQEWYREINKTRNKTPGFGHPET